VYSGKTVGKCGFDCEARLGFRLNIFLPYLRRPRRDSRREISRPMRRVALMVLPSPVFSEAGLKVKAGWMRRMLKRVGPTWLSSPVRRVVQGVCFLAFLWLFFYVAWPNGISGAAALAGRQKIPAASFLAMDPLLSLSTAIAARAWVWSLVWAAGILTACILFPRGFCGYLCPLGTLIDLFDWALGKRVKIFQVRKDGWWVNLKYYLLLAVLICSVCGVLISGFVAAIPVITRGFLFTLAPFQMGAMRGFYQVPALNLGHFLSIGLFFGVLALGFMRPRFWCRYVCPTGAMFSTANVFRAAERKVEDTCIKCNKCVEICPFDAIKADFTTRTAECTLCQTCGGVCPVHAIKFVDRWDKNLLKKENDPETHEIKLTRRGAIGGIAAGVAAAAGIAYLPKVTRAKSTSLPIIRPPGSVPEKEFQELCIRCGECFKACPNNVLQPMGFEGGLNNLWTPQAVPSWSGCEPSCNNCGQVCPTGAIRALPLSEKRVVRMGLAVLNLQTCLPHAGKEACQYCVDVCTSAGYNALEFERVGTQVDDQGMPIEDSGFMAPVVVAEKCVGCGLCQMQCREKNVDSGKLKTSAIVVEAGEGKEDRMMRGSYVQLRVMREKEKAKGAVETPYQVE
jgi:ferredoxin